MSPAGGDSTAFIDEVAITPVVDTLLDGGFEQPALAANTYATDPSGMPWQFSGTAGVANGSIGNSTEAQNAPAGTQVGYLQDTGSMSQTVYLDAGTYEVSFLAAQRTTDQTNYQEIEVLVDGNVLLNTARIEPGNTSYASYQSSAFTVAARAHTIELLGVNPLGGDNTAFLDQVAISPANAISDGSFETPALNAGQYQFAPTGSPWQFSAGGGISSNDSTITSGNPNAPDGTQVAIIQGNGSMSQSVDLARRLVQPLLPGRPMRQCARTEPANRGAGRRPASRLDHAAGHHVIVFTRRRISRFRPERTRSSSSARTRTAARTPP